MATKTLTFTHTRGQVTQLTGPFGPGDLIVINWTVPEGCRRTQIGVAQVQSDATEFLTYQNRTKQGIVPPLFNENDPAPGPRTAMLTANAPVVDTIVHVTVQVPPGPRKR